jgi:hypothetical protein
LEQKRIPSEWLTTIIKLVFRKKMEVAMRIIEKRLSLLTAAYKNILQLLHNG